MGAANAYGRSIIEEHLDVCLEAGLNVEGINAEVATGQWEFQIFSKGARGAGDQIWVARYLLERIGEKYGVSINWHCKPLGSLDWNGSGMHANFSNGLLRTAGSKAIFDNVCEAFRPVIKEHTDLLCEGLGCGEALGDLIPFCVGELLRQSLICAGGIAADGLGDGE